jgi:hypothetical protein
VGGNNNNARDSSYIGKDLDFAADQTNGFLLDYEVVGELGE